MALPLSAWGTSVLQVDGRVRIALAQGTFYPPTPSAEMPARAFFLSGRNVPALAPAFAVFPSHLPSVFSPLSLLVALRPSVPRSRSGHTGASGGLPGGSPEAMCLCRASRAPRPSPRLPPGFLTGRGKVRVSFSSESSHLSLRGRTRGGELAKALGVHVVRAGQACGRSSSRTKAEIASVVSHSECPPSARQLP